MNVPFPTWLSSSLVALVMGAAGCAGSEAGEACEASGSGFTGTDSCRVGGVERRCLTWPIACAGGERPAPHVCEGDPCTVTADCPVEQVCAGTGGETRSCVPREVCGE